MAKDHSSDSHIKCDDIQGVSTSVALLNQSMGHVHLSLNDLGTKVDTIIKQLGEGVGRFKDIEHTQQLTDLRIQTIEKAHAQFAATKQSIIMMLVDKGIGVLLPWAAIAFMVWGKQP